MRLSPPAAKSALLPPVPWHRTALSQAKRSSEVLHPPIPQPVPLPFQGRQDRQNHPIALANGNERTHTVRAAKWPAPRQHLTATHPELEILPNQGRRSPRSLSGWRAVAFREPSKIDRPAMRGPERGRGWRHEQENRDLGPGEEEEHAEGGERPGAMQGVKEEKRGGGEKRREGGAKGQNRSGGKGEEGRRRRRRRKGIGLSLHEERATIKK